LKDIETIKQNSLLFARHLEERMHALRPRWSLPVMLLRLASQSQRVRLKTLEFVDVLSELDSTRDIASHFQMYFEPLRNECPALFRFGLTGMRVPVLKILGARAIQWIIREQLAPYFIIRDEEEFLKVKRRFEKENCIVAVDYLGELVTSSSEADNFLNLYLSAMIRFGGGVKPFHLAVKLSSLYPFLVLKITKKVNE